MHVQKIINRLTGLNLRHIVLIGVIVSLGITEIIVSVMSIYFRGRITYDYLITGGIAAFIVSLFVLSITVYFIAKLREKLRHLTCYDALTDLPNRALFLDSIKASIARVYRQKGCMFAVLLLELDRFKNINDSHGYTTGDQLLIEVAERLKNHVRPFDTAARLGGDVFAILLANIKNIGDVIRATERLHNEVKLPVKIYNHEVYTTASIGITVGKTGFEKPEDILREADTAMHKAKALGRACYVIFDETMHAQATSHLQLENGLQSAVEKNEFLLNYQPIVLSDTNEIVGFEALLRWKFPEKGLLSPKEFIPLAEETGLIIPIGRWVLREACMQMQAWHSQFPEKSHLTISVNISIRQFTPDLVDTIKETLKETGLSPNSLKLEITESVIMNNPETATNIFSQLKDLDIKVQMDDFGTGYSSLGYLYIFPLDALKIDRSFIKSMCHNESTMEVVKTIISMAHNMKMEVIAEGVETISQLEELRKLKCDFYQGYWFSKPLGKEDAEVLLEEQGMS
ncbi:MAG: bifunctional diguanylate cyclase/phosphodiesterase [Nitrospirae bacterium]|nr:bifunctional diguanylate cyclase/phosphodiesterase [Nitrospirota bacterium]